LYRSHFKAKGESIQMTDWGLKAVWDFLSLALAPCQEVERGPSQPPFMKRFCPNIFSVIAAAALLGFTAGCNKPADKGAFNGSGAGGGGEIIVGEFASLTGKEATFGQSSHKGTVLAVEEINAAGGVLGKKLLHKFDDNA